ncbi:hypothetical protein E2F48_02370 [Arthrobacter crusticola]|uniref:Uncharacterized protein n=1 Tax=Arthrobacter crusticola TaxID=2547960 RepID=A0A4R5U2Z7_9MICC|nr:hypothetical protein [Arthrobacter crusticola]TDK27972.1 hypothetical protein E2F48_02370 [Arthrobacter crusticola]
MVILAAVAHLAGFWFHSAGVYEGPANVQIRKFPEDVDFLFVGTFAASIIGLKYVVYEFTARAFGRSRGSRATRVCFYTGYVIALAIDMASLFLSSEPVADAGFALLGAVLKSPLVLIGSIGAIEAVAFWNSRRLTTGATRAPGP